jgi:sugar phosphate permease
MRDASRKVHGYRWVVLAVFMMALAVNQLGWITFAPITVEASAFYGVSDLAIGLLSLIFMALYVLLFLPAAWMIDTLGFRRAVALGSVLTALGALGRGIFASSFAAVFVCQLLIAVGQPFILGAVTSAAARWFSLDEQGTAAGLGSLAIYIGIIGGIGLTPLLLARVGMRGMLLVWGIASVVACLAFLLAAREAPASRDHGPAVLARPALFDGMRSMMGQKDFVLLLVIFFVGLGVFNGVTTWIEQIVEPRGFSAAQAGLAGALMIAGGIVGAVVIPILSDSVRRRKPFIIAALAGMTPSLLGVALAESYWLLLVSAALFGFFLLSSGPIGFQYGAEVTRPLPEGTSNTLLVLMGQISGIALIFAMDALKTAQGSMKVPMLGLVALLAASLVLSLFLKESPIASLGDSRP